MNIYEFALSLFRPLVIKKSERLNTLSENLKKAQFTNATAEEYYAEFGIAFLMWGVAIVIDG